MQDGLRIIQMIIADLCEKNQYASRVILPANYRYAGHEEFIHAQQKTGGNIQMITIPEIQPDGTQDLSKMREVFEGLKQAGLVAMIIDQEMNNNGSGFDRDESLNEELASLLQDYAGTVFYVGDIAY